MDKEDDMQMTMSLVSDHLVPNLSGTSENGKINTHGNLLFTQQETSPSPNIFERTSSSAPVIQSQITQNYSSRMTSLYIIVFLNAFSVGLYIPCIPELLLKACEENLSRATLLQGRISSLGALLEVGANSFLGTLSDRNGRKPFLLLSLSGQIVNLAVICLYSEKIVSYFIGRVFYGITAAFLTVVNSTHATSCIGDMQHAEPQLASSFGMVGAAFGLGFAIAPGLSAVLSKFYSSIVPLYVSLLLEIFVFSYISYSFEETRLQLSTVDNHSRNIRHYLFSGIRLFLKNTSMVFFGIGILLLGMNEGIFTIIYMYCHKRFQWQTAQLGLFLSNVGLIALISQGLIIRWLVPFLGEQQTLLLSIVVDAIQFFGYGLATSGWWLFIISWLACISFCTFPALNALLSKTVTTEECGSLQGGIQSLRTITRIISPLLFSKLLRIGEFSMLPLGLPFWICSLFCILAWLCLFKACRRLSG
eukprot:jgi/Galph1/4744/GphlegSOOS_G3396.1